jgi:serine phosphatase RsbU (regulator of sigma subunit)
VEIALYLAGAAATFGSLLRNLIVSSSAALGLVASMLLIWARFPNYVRGKQLEQQTELARQVQTDLLPSPSLTFENVDFAAECVPAWQVGGDFYDVFSAPDGPIAIVLGDVSGKGLPASVVAGLLVGAIRSSPWLHGSAEHEAASTQLSELLRTRTSGERFASLFWCYYEPENLELRYVNAGHLPPMVVSQNSHGAVEIQRLEEGGPVLGVLTNAVYRQGAAVVTDGALLVLYSDGVVEATNASDEQFGEERLRAVLSQSAGKPPTEICNEILKQVQFFLGKERAQDDLTLVVARLQSTVCAVSQGEGRLASHAAS